MGSISALYAEGAGSMPAAAFTDPEAPALQTPTGELLWREGILQKGYQDRGRHRTAPCIPQHLPPGAEAAPGTTKLHWARPIDYRQWSVVLRPTVQRADR